MSVLFWLLCALLSASLALGAVALYLQGRRQDSQDEVLARLQLGMVQDETNWSQPTQIRNPLLRMLCQRCWRAGLELSAGQMLWLLLACAVLAGLLVVVLGPLLALILLVFAFVALALVLQQLAGHRRRQVVMQLPEFLEHVLRALIAGNTLEEAFAESARESAEPLRSLFMNAARQVRLGEPIEDALTQLADLHALPDVRVLAMSARVNRRYGGSIRNMIKSLVQVIRARGTAERELRALTAETRFSALLLFVIPVGITLFILLRNPGFYADMWADDTGRLLLLAAVGLQAAGGLLIWRMLRGTESGA